MERPELIKALQKLNGRFFAVEFIKRTTGEKRRMVCRLGVKKHLKGGGLNYDPATLNLITVWDVNIRQYRSIPVENILSIKGVNMPEHLK